MKTTQKTLKALSLWQPWASLILHGHKQFETRSWFTDYRGELIVHAAKQWKENQVGVLSSLSFKYKFIEEDLSKPPHMITLLGKAVAVCDLVDCIPITHDFRARQTQLELDCGNWALGRWAWRLDNVRAIDPPIPIKGHQRLWNINPSILEQ